MLEVAAVESGRLHDDETTEEVAVLAEEDDPLEVFLSRLDDQYGAMPDEDGSWQHVRIVSRLPQFSLTHLWMVVLFDCMLLLIHWLDLMAAMLEPYPTHDERVRVPIVSDGALLADPQKKSILLNVGFDEDLSHHDFEHPLLFYAGEQFPALECYPVLERESQLIQDLGFDPARIPFVIRADHQCPHGVITELIRMGQNAGFRKFRLRVQIDSNDTSN